MSLREQFADDVDEIFDSTEEFATERDFRISDGKGGFIVIEKVPVVWDEESAKKQPIVAIHGVYLGDVICFIACKYLPRPPVAGELIYSPVNQPWEVLQCTNEESQYKLALSMTRTQAGRYGNN